MTDQAPALRITGLTKSYGSVRALDGIDLDVRPGTVHCVLGENGAGKSTLCHAIGGSLVPDAGTLHLYGQEYAPRRPADALAAGIALVHQHFSLVATLTVEQNLRLLRLPDLEGGLARVRDEYGLDVRRDAVVADLPVAARQQVEIVKALLRAPRLLLLDEPTGVLGPAETDALLATCRRIAAAGGAVVLVTHKLGEAVRAGDEATVLRGGRVAGGGPLTRLGPSELVPLMIGRAADSLDAGLLGAVGPAEPSARPERTQVQVGPPALELAAVVVRRPDGTHALDGVDVAIGPGEIVGIAGVEGNGQSELMSVLGGSSAPDSGRIVLDGQDVTGAGPAARTRAGLGVVPEDRHHEGCVPELSIAENLHLGRLGRFRKWGVVLDRAALARATEQVIAAHGIRAQGPQAPMTSLSGGNQQKVVLARELALDPLIALAAAQPTRGLDIGAVAAVHARIREAAARGAAVLLVSAELDELLTLSDRILVAYRGHLLGPVNPRDAAARERIGELMVGAGPRVEVAS
ncbi:ABC transporter ATP-binding protein [Streptomyces sp. VRA16 Mangrove soil]|uniref:ABC transporter ATP-binding protein n=1 Tax=Streptomyces sp. VRA16 Mangrove soil TaxID=2817434 RepID=UPI001A9E3ECC|nr:ABC transporter ATP-binding protein [Streptomyces sp. VRA16 Mangrove soil]MBO1332844.1 ABC transporter ATP-binding protein [Streptomyces sp. VRA16 Mangrove soil]